MPQPRFPACPKGRSRDFSSQNALSHAAEKTLPQALSGLPSSRESSIPSPGKSKAPVIDTKKCPSKGEAPPEKSVGLLVHVESKVLRLPEPSTATHGFSCRETERERETPSDGKSSGPDASRFTSCLLRFLKVAGCAACFQGAEPGNRARKVALGAAEESRQLHCVVQPPLGRNSCTQVTTARER